MTTLSKAEFLKPSHEDVAVDETPVTPEPIVEATSSESEDVAPTELELLRAQHETLEKRFKDTQAFGQKAHQANLARLNDDMEAGAITAEDYATKVAEFKSNDVAMTENPMSEIATQFDSEKDLVIGVMGYGDEEAESYIQAFNQTMSMDKSIEDQLMALPANQRTKWVLEQGKEMAGNVALINEHGGALGVIKHLQQNQPDMAKLEEELRAKIMDEFKQQPKPTLSGMTGSAGAKTSVTKASIGKKAHLGL